MNNSELLKQAKNALEQSTVVVAGLAKALESVNEKNQELEKEKKCLEKRTEVLDRMTSRDKWFDGKEIAKLLNYKGYGRNTIYALLRDGKIFDSHNAPYQFYVDRGYFKIVIKENEYNGVFYNVPLVSAKGIEFVKRVIDEHNAEQD